MARRFEMHRAGPARQGSGIGIAPLASRAGQTAGKTTGRERLAGRPGSEPAESTAAPPPAPSPAPAPAEEIGGPEGPEPTRYGDWEKNGICYDF